MAQSPANVEEHTCLAQANDDISRLQRTLAGAAAGSASAFLLSPFDVIRTRMQVHATLPSSIAAQYGTIWSSAKNIWKEERIRGFFRGYGTASILVPGFWSIYFPLYEDLKKRTYRIVCDTHSDSRINEILGSNITLRQILAEAIAAGMAGTIGDIITYPLWTVRTRQQTNHMHNVVHRLSQYQAGKQNVKSPSQATISCSILNTFRTILREDGIPGLYRGLPAALMGTLHTAIQFPVYEILKRMMIQYHFKVSFTDTQQTSLPLPYVALASAFSKLIASLFTYPFDLLRSRLQDDRGTYTKEGKHVSGNAISKQYKNTWHAAKIIWKQTGLRGFYDGFSVNTIRALPATAVTLSVYETIAHDLRLRKTLHEFGDNM